MVQTADKGGPITVMEKNWFQRKDGGTNPRGIPCCRKEWQEDEKGDNRIHDQEEGHGDKR